MSSTMVAPRAALLLAAGLALAVVAGAHAAVFYVDQGLLQRLKQVAGYHRLHQVHPFLYVREPKEALIEHLMAEIDFGANWSLSLDEFRREYFARPCAAATELYAARRDYLDQLPPVDADPDADLLCRLGLVVRDCTMYLEDGFVQDVFIDMLRRAIKS